MSAVCILNPVVIATWPAFGAAVMASATSLGYEVAAEVGKKDSATLGQRKQNSVQLDIERSEVVIGQLGREQSIAVTRDGVTVRFSRDACWLMNCWWRTMRCEIRSGKIICITWRI